VALDTALRDCTRAIELSDSPAAALDSRAMVYFRMNRLDEAIGDLDAALETVPDMPAALYLRGVVRKAKGDAGGSADLAAARMMAPRIDIEYAKWGVKP
jgi:regulator of sirC expression with transglutaminase-like and TPR domain